MAEVLGAVSAVTQLAALCCSSLRVMQKMKAANSTLQNYQTQFEELAHLSRSISRNPLLQTTEIEALAQSLLYLISQSDLTIVLKKHPFIRTVYILYKERDLLDTLTALERQKLSLNLIINQIQSSALYEIRAGIKGMSDEKQAAGESRVEAHKKTERNPHLLLKDDLEGISAPSESNSLSTWVDTSSDGAHTIDSTGHETPPIGGISNLKIYNVSEVNVGGSWVVDASDMVRLRGMTKIDRVAYAGDGNVHIGPEVYCTGNIKSTFNVPAMIGSINGVTMHGEKGSRLSVGATVVIRDEKSNSVAIRRCN